MNFKTLWQTFMLYFLFVCVSMYADMRIPFVADGDTVKIPKDTIQIDTTGMRDIAPIMLTPSVPPSPQAEAFQRLGDFTVNNASGTPDISIPLYEINHNGYRIPIVLRYIATPLKPGYNYDVTGHGWSLTPGSCISRTIATAPDEMYDFTYSSLMMNGYYRDFYNSYNNYNYQFDKFNAVLPNGTSFQFYVKKENTSYQYVVSTNRKMKISIQISTGTITGFIVTDDSGVKYTFNVADISTDPIFGSRNVTWYLSRVDLPNITSPILFYYNASIRQEHVDGLAEKILTITNYNPVMSENQVLINTAYSSPCHYRTKLLTRIEYGPESVVFNYKNGNVESEYNYLTKIKVTGLKEFRLSYSFHTLYPQTITLANLCRLVETGASSQSDSLVYKFHYTSMGAFQGTDHWGYYTNDYYYQNNLANMNFYCECMPIHNTNLTNSHLLTSLGTDPDGWCPYQKYRLMYIPSVAEPRHALSPAYHMVLDTLTYPTGGKTLFRFENHQFVTATAANGDYIATKRQRRVIEGGGFRIKSIINYDSDNNVVDNKQYRYGPTFKEANQQNLNLPIDPNNNSNEHIGFGEPVVDPNILTYCRFTSSDNLLTSLKNMMLGLDTNGQRTNFSNPFTEEFYNTYPWRFDLQFSPVFFRSLLRGRNAVVYPEITEYHGDIDNGSGNTTGKTVYKYDIYSEQEDSVYYERLEYYGNTLDLSPHTAQKLYPTERNDYAYEGGQFKLKRKETYSYQTTGGSIYDYVYKNIYSPGFGYQYMIMNNLFQSRLLLVDSYLLTGKTTTNYYSNGSLTTTEGYDYDANELICAKRVTGNKLMTTTYTHPSLSDTGYSHDLAYKNIFTTVLESRTKTGEGSSQVDVSGYKTDYENYTTGGLLPSRQYYLNTDFSSSSFEEDVHVLSYTSCGNPLEVVDRSGLHTVYLWSYNDRYLVAEIKNATLTQVNTALNTIFNTNANGLASLSSVASSSLKSLRTNSSLSGALVTTWTHAPLIGVTSQTDPSGVSTYYSYDSLGRLTEIYRYKGNTESTSNKRILNQYTYHTKTN